VAALLFVGLRSLSRPDLLAALGPLESLFHRSPGKTRDVDHDGDGRHKTQPVESPFERRPLFPFAQGRKVGGERANPNVQDSVGENSQEIAKDESGQPDMRHAEEIVRKFRREEGDEAAEHDDFPAIRPHSTADPLQRRMSLHAARHRPVQEVTGNREGREGPDHHGGDDVGRSVDDTEKKTAGQRERQAGNQEDNQSHINEDEPEGAPGPSRFDPLKDREDLFADIVEEEKEDQQHHHYKAAADQRQCFPESHMREESPDHPENPNLSSYRFGRILASGGKEAPEAGANLIAPQRP
jgi:hypothetical protein